MNNLLKIFAALFFSVSLCAETVSVMTFNVENLFDNKNDAYKTDETYLEFSKKQTPLHIKNCEKISTKRWRDDCLYIDWTDEVIEHKLNSIASVILSYGSNGPDIIGLQEVENKRILKQLFKKLEEAGIDPVLFGITDKDFQVLARNFAQIRQKLQETNNLLEEYKKYYEDSGNTQ